MEDPNKTPSLNADNGYGGRGAGGKFRKPPRKPPATPYDRPLTSNRPAASAASGGWLSKIVDPACRLIAGGASRIFPSFFTKSTSSPALPPTENKDRTDAKQPELTTNAEDSVKGSSSSLLFRSAERGGPSEVADGLKKVSDQNEFDQDKVKNSSESTDFSRFKQLLEGKTFSRDEINHLLEILNSRVDMEGEKKKPIGGGAEPVNLTQEIPRTPVEEKLQGAERSIIGTSIPKSDVTGMQEISRTPLEGSKKDIDRPIVGPSIQKTDVTGVVGASPVDIAQAYMGSRASGRGREPYSFVSKGNGAQQLTDEFVANPSPPKPLICWPGAEVHNGHGYVTPLSHRDRYGHLDYPRTPYSRTISSKSRIKDSWFQNRSSTPLQQSQTVYGQENTVGDAVDVYGSVGPIRRIRNKFASEVRPRGSTFVKSFRNARPETEKSNLSKGLLPSTEKKLEPGETSTSRLWPEEPVAVGSEPGSQIPNQSFSSEAVRKILEHLDRNKPTLHEKAAELKLATAWRRTSDEASDAIAKENVSLKFGAVGSLKNTGPLSPKLPQLKNNSSNAIPGFQFQDRGREEDNGDANENAKRSSAGVAHPGITTGFNEWTNSGLKNTFDPQNSFITTSNGQKETAKPPSQVPFKDQSTISYGHKPSLPSISIQRPNPSAVSSDNGLGFTFPFSAKSGILSEPPTPSIMPLLCSTSAPSQPKDMPSVPSYSFGTNKATPRLVFSFPSTSSTSVPDASDLKFEFGSSKEARLSFSTFGKDTVCC